LSVPVVGALGGWPILSAEAGARFGIPGFLPWPLKTILDFCLVVGAVGAVVKVLLTAGVACFLIRSGPRRRVPAGT